jgi:upstream activation factor subunit UAF30
MKRSLSPDMVAYRSVRVYSTPSLCVGTAPAKAERSVTGRVAGTTSIDTAAKERPMATSKTKSDGKGGSALQKPVTPSKELAAIVGDNPLPRTEVTKKVWDYIKANKLQNEKDRRSIDADEKLEKIFGKKQVTMFEMTKLVNQHLKA